MLGHIAIDIAMDQFRDQDIKRKVWESANDSKLLTVSGLLETGEYTINRTVKDNGNVELEFIPIEED